MRAGLSGQQTGFVLEEQSFADIAGRVLSTFALPMGIIVATVAVFAYSPDLPDFLAVLKVYGPYFTLGVGLLVSLAFKRGRALVAVFSLLVAYAGIRLFVAGDTGAADSRAVLAAIGIFVPFNLALLSLLSERGALNAHGARRFALVVVEVGVTAAVMIGDYPQVIEWVWQPVFPVTVLPGSPLPQIALVMMAGALVVRVASAVVKASVVEGAMAVAVAAFAAACHGLGSLDVYAWLTSAGIVLTAAVLQDSYRMAYRDELTGLPGRRALHESMLGLDGRYTVAMIDIDHFKRFNDTWGHDVGDQVLRLVASRIGRAGGGGRAFRYGGEEFIVVFPGRRVLEVLARVDRLRRNVESYRLRIRAGDRSPAGAEAGTHALDPEFRMIAGTISIGIAETGDKRTAPEEVIAAADSALYRAKAEGRNRVCR